MKSKSLKMWIVAFLAIGLSVINSGIARPVKASLDFTKLRGTYHGSWVLTANGFSAPGSVTVRISVPKRGKTMTVSISGTADASGTPIPISTTLTFNGKKRTLVSNALLMGYFSPIATDTTRFAGKGPFTATLTASPGATLAGNSISGSIPYTFTFGRHSLLIQGSGVVAVSGTPATVSLSVSANK
jgi:hypothetical protein